MAYTGPHGYLTILGDSYGGAEEWQTGIRLMGTTPPTEAQMEAVDTAVTTFLTTGALRFTAGFRYLSLKWAPQTAEGRYPEGEDAVEWLRPTPLAGTTSGGFPQIALVTSWRTARSRGRGSNGRSYWPSVQTIASATGRFPLNDGTLVAAAAAQLIASLEAAGIGTPAVMSAVGTGITEPITGVRVGLVMDTQRRRRNGISEEYTETAAVPS